MDNHAVSRRPTLKYLGLLGATAISRILLLLPLALTMSAQEWRFYGGDAGGTRHSPLKQINRQNVKNLKRVWTYHMGEVDRGASETDRHNIAPFESTPIVNEGVLYFSTPSNRVIALDAETGQEVWQFDPQAGRTGPRQFFQHRGVTYWQSKTGGEGRILYGTFDGRLIALDARSGKPCPESGKNGTVDLPRTLIRVQNIQSHRLPPSITIWSLQGRRFRSIRPKGQVAMCGRLTSARANSYGPSIPFLGKEKWDTKAGKEMRGKSA